MDDRHGLDAQESDLRDTTVGDVDVQTHVVLRFALALVAATAVVCALMWGLTKYLANDLARHDAPRTQIVATSPVEAAPGPRLQSDPNADMAKLRAEENAALGSYAWLTPEKTAARIPIERAMEIVLEKGLPKGTGAPQAPAAAEGAR